ncbi:MAG: hypothetical protein AB7O96_06080 [Pseudobdellovibrionaceae bacterium]
MGSRLMEITLERLARLKMPRVSMDDILFKYFAEVGFKDKTPEQICEEVLEIPSVGWL